MLQQRKASVVASWLICALLIYVASYLWFLRSHTSVFTGGSYWAVPPYSFTTFATGNSDSFLLVLFYPAICVTATFDEASMLDLTDASKHPLPGRHIYPFVEVQVITAHPSSTPSPAPSPAT